MNYSFSAERMHAILNSLDLTDGKERIDSVEVTPSEVWNGLNGNPVAVIIGIVADPDDGEFERIPRQNEGFSDLQNGVTYFTVEIVKQLNGKTISEKSIRKAIMSNQAPLLYQEIKAGYEAMLKNNGEFEPIILEGHNIILHDCKYEKPFYVPSSNTKSGWTEDGNGIPVQVWARQLLLFKGFEQLQTVVRRDLRNLEYSGAFGSVANDDSRSGTAGQNTTQTSGKSGGKQVPSTQTNQGKTGTSGN